MVIVAVIGIILIAFFYLKKFNDDNARIAQSEISQRRLERQNNDFRNIILSLENMLHQIGASEDFIRHQIDRINEEWLILVSEEREIFLFRLRNLLNTEDIEGVIVELISVGLIIKLYVLSERNDRSIYWAKVVFDFERPNNFLRYNDKFLAFDIERKDRELKIVDFCVYGQDLQHRGIGVAVYRFMENIVEKRFGDVSVISGKLQSELEYNVADYNRVTGFWKKMGFAIAGDKIRKVK